MISGFLYAGPSLVLIVLTVVRWHDALTESPARSLWWCVLGLTVFVTLQIPPLSDALARAANLPLAGAVLANCGVYIVIVGIHALVGAVRHPERIGRRDARWYVTAFVTSIGMLLFISPLMLARDVHLFNPIRAQIYEPDWGGWLYWFVFYAGTIAGNLRSTLLCFGASRQSRGPLRTGLQLIVVGDSMALVSMLLKLVALVTIRLAPNDPSAGQKLAQTAVWLLAAAITVIAVGSSYNTVHTWLMRAAGSFSERRSISNLTPLWEALRSAYPEIAAGIRGGSELRLIRRIVEIRDGVLANRSFLDATAETNARRLVRATVEDDDPRLEAARIVAGVAAKAAGRPQTRSAPPMPLMPGLTIHAEVRWLENVAFEYERLTSSKRARSSWLQDA